MSDTSAVELADLQLARVAIEGKASPVSRTSGPGREGVDMMEDIRKKQAGRARELTINLRDAEIVTTEAQAIGKAASALKGRDIDPATGEVKKVEVTTKTASVGLTADQLEHVFGETAKGMKANQQIIHDAVLIRNKEFDKLSEKDVITQLVADQLATHAGFIAVWPDFNPKDAKHREVVKTYLANPRTRNLIISHLNTSLSAEQPDAAKLQSLLQEQWKLNNQLTNRNTEKTTLEHDISTRKTELGKFKKGVYDLDMSTTPPRWRVIEAPGDYAKAIEDIESQINIKTHEKSQVDLTIQTADTLSATRPASRPWVAGGSVTLVKSIDPFSTQTISSDADLSAYLAVSYPTLKQQSVKLNNDLQEFNNKKKFITDKEAEIRVELSAKEGSLARADADLDEAKEGSLAKKKKDKDAEVEAEKKKVVDAEKKYFQGIQNIFTDSVIDLLVETSGDVKELKGTLHERAAKKAQDAIYEAVWDPKKREVDIKKLKDFVDIIKNSQRKGGVSRWAEEIGERVIGMATPGSENLLKDYFKSIQNDPELLKQFGKDMFLEVGKFVNYKDPKAFDKIFTPDEVAMMKMREDVLPDLIREVKNNKELAKEVSKAIGEDITKSDTWVDKLKSKAFNWKTISGLLVLLALGLVPGVGGWVATGKAVSGWAAATADKWGPALYNFAMENHLPAIKSGIDATGQSIQTGAGAAGKYIWPDPVHKTFLPHLSQ